MEKSEYKEYAKERMAEIEQLLKRTSKSDLKVFREINSLLSVWSEYNYNMSEGRKNEIAPDWFYPYINSL